MKFYIVHENRERMRISLIGKRLSYSQADILLYYLQALDMVVEAKVYERTADATLRYRGSRRDMIEALKAFQFNDEKNLARVPEHTGRELNAYYQAKLVHKVVGRILTRALLPYPLRVVYTGVRSAKYIIKGIKCLMRGKIEVDVLDATAIAVSLFRNDISTAGSIMFLLGIGEILEEWTHKKSVDDLARSISLNIEKVWLVQEEGEVLVPISDIVPGNLIAVHMGNIIPLDGVVHEGEAMINQASLTGEAISVSKRPGGYVYAGTAVEEGNLVISVKETSGKSKFDKIVHMIEESEKLKSAAEYKATNIADRLVLYTFAATGLAYLTTGNVTKALSILMVDFSCALKLAIPIAVLSGIREANAYHITIKGGKSVEEVANADTIVFDKTGTLTKARPTVKGVVTFSGNEEKDMLRIAACLEEHFPHSIANAVVLEAKNRNLTHDEMHTKVDYIVAHGISSFIDEKKVVIGSHHFVFDDEGCVIPPGEEERFNNLPLEYSHLYLAIEGVLVAVILIEDPLRKEAKEVIQTLKEYGIKKIVMMTGDSERTAKVIAERVGVDEYYSEVLPEDKANFVEAEKAKGRKVIMIGDGINDSPALSAADVGIAISEGAAIAREIADVTISADDLYELVTLKQISNRLMKRIDGNYKFVIGFNMGLILLGLGGFITPTTSALLHNASTLGVSLKNMEPLLLK